jgi:hypothetical protein
VFAAYNAISGVVGMPCRGGVVFILCAKKQGRFKATQAKLALKKTYGA